jgi:large subunit ribosomal protein LP0
MVRPGKKNVSSSSSERVFPERKVRYFKQANLLLDKYDKILIVVCDNVQSQQMQKVRHTLRGTAEVLMGKNTQIRRVMQDRCASGNERDKIMYDKIVAEGLVYGNVGMIMTNGDLQYIRKKLEENKIQAPARQGAVAPLDVTVPAGNTGLEPTKTSFFQALNIGTKITKGTVEILKDEKVITKGEKVGSSEATLLQMLGIKPFFYGLQLKFIYDQGSVYTTEVLDLTDDDIKKKFEAGISRVTGLSLGAAYTTSISFPHVLMNAFKRALAVTVATDYTAEKHKDLKEAILSGKLIGAPAPAAAAVKAAEKAEVKAEAPKKVVEEEPEDEDMGFGLFD